MANAVSERIDAGGVALGLIVRLAKSGEIARIARASGHDFLFVDCQHGAFSKPIVEQLIQSALGSGLAAIVRVRNPEDPDMSIWLDCGASGIIAPDLRGVAEAERFVDMCRFPPEGQRSYGGAVVQYGYRTPDLAQSLTRLNRETLCIGMIETVEAVDSIEAIAAVKGLDILHVGLVDLSIALGTPGEVSSPVVNEAVARIIAAVRKSGKLLGIGGERDPARRRNYVKEGARFMTTDIDTNLLLRGAEEAVQALRGG